MKTPTNAIVLVYAPGKGGEPHIVPNNLEAMQEIVGGYIELVRLRAGSRQYDMYCNEEALLEELRFNRRVGVHEIHGTFFVTKTAVGDDSGEMVSLSAEDIVRIRKHLEPNYQREAFS